MYRCYDIIQKRCLGTYLDVNMLTRKFVRFFPQNCSALIRHSNLWITFFKPFKCLSSNCLQSWPSQYADVSEISRFTFYHLAVIIVFLLLYSLNLDLYIFFNGHRRKICVLNMILKIIIWTMNELNTIKKN